MMSEASFTLPPKKIVFSNPRAPVLSPLDKARLQIGMLASDPELITIGVFGRSKTAEEVAENERRRALYLEKKVAIIKEHAVQEEYLKPLLVKQKQLWEELLATNCEIDAIRS